MQFHISMAAERPEQAARLVAELWGGRAYPFPPVADGSWIAVAGDDRGSAIEVYPLATELREGDCEPPVRGATGGQGRGGPVHVAIATELGVESVKLIAKRFGAPARVCSRGPFKVIEIRAEGGFTIEVLTAKMQAEYLASFHFAGWKSFLATAGLAEAA
jgi:hypothetical protein